MTTKKEDIDIVLIEVREDHIENINIPFTLWGRLTTKRGLKMRSLFGQLTEQRRMMANTWKEIDSLFKENYDETK